MNDKMKESIFTKIKFYFYLVSILAVVLIIILHFIFIFGGKYEKNAIETLTAKQFSNIKIIDQSYFMRSPCNKDTAAKFTVQAINSEKKEIEVYVCVQNFLSALYKDNIIIIK